MVTIVYQYITTRRRIQLFLSSHKLLYLLPAGRKLHILGEPSRVPYIIKGNPLRVPLFFLLTPCDYTSLYEGVEKQLLASHGIYAILPPDHPLMAQSLISLHQLAGETLVIPYFVIGISTGQLSKLAPLRKVFLKICRCFLPCSFI